MERFNRSVWYSDDSFCLEGEWYKREGGRCYRLDDSICLRPDCDGKLARRRISGKDYESLLKACKEKCEAKRMIETYIIDGQRIKISPAFGHWSWWVDARDSKGRWFFLEGKEKTKRAAKDKAECVMQQINSH